MSRWARASSSRVIAPSVAMLRETTVTVTPAALAVRPALPSVTATVSVCVDASNHEPAYASPSCGVRLACSRTAWSSLTSRCLAASADSPRSRCMASSRPADTPAAELERSALERSTGRPSGAAAVAIIGASRPKAATVAVATTPRRTAFFVMDFLP
jgi:hypothetical protein